MIIALTIGFFGSLHCVGMCGPLMITFIGPNKSPLSIIYYNSGRIIAYAIIGLITGLLSSYLELLQFQRVATLVIGLLLILLYAIPSIRINLEKFYYQSRFSKLIRSLLSKNLSSGKKWLLSGFANGLLPCGLTYVAAAGALVQGSLYSGVFYMLLFGLGTLPALVGIYLGSTLMMMRYKNIIPAATTSMAIFSGLILLFRGALMTFPDFDQLVRANAISLISVCGL